MRLYIDLRTNQIMRNIGLTGQPPAAQVQFKRGRAVPLEVQFLRDGVTPTRITANTLEFAVKPVGEFDVAPLVYVADWTIPLEGDADPVYVGYPSFDTAAINALFAIDGDETNDVASIELQGEVNWRQDSGPIASTDNFRLTVLNDILRPTDIVPTPLDPPDAYERKSNRGAADGYAPLNASAKIADAYLPDYAPLVGGVVPDANLPDYAPLVDGKVPAANLPVVPFDVALGFTAIPTALEVDRVTTNRGAVFATTGHTLWCAGTPVTAPEFLLKLNGTTIATVTAADGFTAVTLDAETTLTGNSLLTLEAPDATLTGPTHIQLYLKGALT